MHINRFISLSLMAALGSGLAQAQEDADDIDNILVTASLTPLARAEAGNAVTVISRDQIEQRQARYVTDMLRTVPGFSVSHVGTTGSQTQVRVRGAEANHVLVLIDGIRANDPATGDEFRWEYLSTSNVERIEIVRGPQSSIWGSDAIAGVVNVITRSGARAPNVGGYAEGGSFGTVNAGFQGGAGSDNWSLSYGLERLVTDGTNISRAGDETDDSNLTTVSLGGSVRATEALSIDGGVRYVDAYTQFDPVDFFTTGLPIDGDRATDSEQVFAHVGAKLDTLNGRLVHSLSGRFLDTRNSNLADGTESGSTDSDRVTLTYQGDIQISENVLSLAYVHENTDFRQRGEALFGDPNQDQQIAQNSVMADFQGRMFDDFTWLLSARYDGYSDFDSALTGRLAGAYRLGTDSKLRASVGTGQKIPTFTERFGFFADSFVGNPDLKPEKSTSYEIGIDQGLLDGGLQLQFTLFHQDLEDEINGFVFDPDSFLITAENQSGRSTRSGAEFSAKYAINEQLELGAMYTFTDAEQEDPAGDKSRELRRPEHVGSLSVNYRLLDERAGLLLVADYGGAQLDRFFPPFPQPSEIVTLDSYWLLDLTAGYDLTRNVNLFARFTNLLDEDYENVYGYATPGRAAYVGVTVSYGE